VNCEQRFALLIEYDGTEYVGSQFQANGPTIQSVIESVLERLTGEHRRLALAGRTDSGVHAIGQVGAITVSDRWTARSLAIGLNALLPADIAIRRVAKQPLDFNPRRDAQRRWYRYTICNQGFRPAIGRQYAWHIRQNLDLGLMQTAADRLVGEHDFAAFAGKLGNPQSGTRRTIHSASVSRAGPEVRIDIEANAFLPHQMRRIAGSMVQVGTGRLGIDELQSMAEAAKPASIGPTAPSLGLCLMQVTYDRDLFDITESLSVPNEDLRFQEEPITSAR
jgi:tRNA pseudouridine38-40 synthase